MNLSRIEKDKKKRKLFAKYELKRIKLKSIISNLALSRSIRIEALQKLNKLPKNSSKTRIRNRCVITGRPQGILRFFKLSRIQVRKLALNGELLGIKKSS